jgi:hypothetical protein
MDFMDDNKQQDRKKGRRIPGPQGFPGGIPKDLAEPPAPHEADNPFVVAIAALMDRLCKVSNLNPYVVVTDWLRMVEASLRRYTANVVSYAVTGDLLEDPPDIEETFSRVRSRYTEASKCYPSAYREMQMVFSSAFALLAQSALPGVESFGRQVEFNPDVAGRVFYECVQPGSAWWLFFPSWQYALAAARIGIIEPADIIQSRIKQADLLYITSTDTPLRPEPGEKFDLWFEAILPFMKPIFIGQEMINSPATMLATAAQFPHWALWQGVVQVLDTSPDPIINNLMQINSRLYSLNGFGAEIMNAAAYITEGHRQAGEEVVIFHPALAFNEDLGVEMGPEELDELMRQVRAADQPQPPAEPDVEQPQLAAGAGQGTPGPGVDYPSSIKPQNPMPTFQELFGRK